MSDTTTILIVEDEAIVAADLSGKLRRLGYEIAGTAAGGEEAVEMACRLRPQLILMDIRLEGSMDGIEAAEAIQSRHDVPVIYLTAHSDAATLARAKLTGPFGYILKPFEERELATQIELALYKYQVDRQLRDQREWLRVTLTSIGDAVIATDAGGRITFINPVAESLTGWKADEASGRPLPGVFRIVNEQTGEALKEPVGSVLLEGRPVEIANHAALVTRGGRVVPIEDSAAPIMDAGGKVIGAVLVFHDVTEKRRAEAALRASEQRLRLASSAARLGVFEWDVPTDTAHWENERMYEIFGRTAEQGPLSHAAFFADTIEPEERLLFDRALMEAMHPDKLFHTVCRIRRCSDGQPCWIEFSGRFDMKPDGSARRLVGVIADVTERKRMEDEIRQSRDELDLRVRERTAELEEANDKLRRYNRQLNVLNKELQDFAFVASHDLQEPLRKVQTFGDMLAARCGVSLDETSRDYLRRMRSAAERMQNLLDSLLAYSRVTTKAEPLQETDLRKSLETALINLEIMIGENNARLEIGNLPTVSADPVQMVQLFQNLVGNAVKFHRQDAPPQVKVYTRGADENKAYEICVEDNGIGFEENYLEKIFLPFQRLHGRNSEYEGAGIGLAICRKIVERHGGKITAKSKSGKGSTFIVTLPAKMR